jgi:hypothetical protein
MDMKHKAAQVFDLLRLPLADMDLRHRSGDGLNVYETDSGGIRHRICYPDEVLAQRDPKDLAMVAALIFTLLRSDPGPAQVVIRSGMFETMLRATSHGPNPLAVMP